MKNKLDYESFYDRVGRLNGWDFSNVQSFSEGMTWEYEEEVRKRCENTDVLLDLGTGGGENLLKLSSLILFGIGIDISDGMIDKANANLADSTASNIRFFQMASENLQFPTRFFDIITSRHAPFSASEVFRVLKKGGYFITQQVSEADKYNLKEAFGRGQSFPENDGELKERYLQELQEAGLSNIQAFEYDATEYYQRPEDLIFLLKHTPIIPDFGKHENDFEVLSDFIEKNSTGKGIRTNSKRFLIIGEK